MSRNRTGVLAALAVAATLTLTGCGGSTVDESPKPGPTAGSNIPDDDTISDLPVEPEPEAEPDPLDFIVAFGETFTWEDGVALRVDPPAPYQLSEYATPTTGQAMNFQVTVVNGSDLPLDVTSIYPNVTSGNVTAEWVIDVGTGAAGPPQTPVLPGAEVTFPQVFDIVDPSYIVMELQPSYEHTPPLLVTNADL